MTSIHNNETQAVPMATLDKFELFPSLPPELRIKIWKMAILPERVFITPSGDKDLPLITTDIPFRGVNVESREIYEENHSLCFNGTWFNPVLDTLCLAGGLCAMREILKHYPDDMHRVRVIEVVPVCLHGFKRRPDFWMTANMTRGFAYNLSGLSGLQSLELVTVRWDFGVRHALFSEDNAGEYVDETYPSGSMDWRKKDFLQDALNCVREGLLPVDHPDDVPYEGAQIACLYPRMPTWAEQVYFQSSQDLKRASYGRILGDLPDILKESEIKWLESGAEWVEPDYEQHTNAYNQEIFTRLIASRSRIENLLPIEPQLAHFLRPA